MLFENADLIWDDFAQTNRQEGERIGRAKLAYGILLRAYIRIHPSETIEQLIARLDRMTTEKLLTSIYEIIENIRANE